MTLTKQSENFSISDKFNDKDVTGNVTIGTDSININVNIANNSPETPTMGMGMYASANINGDNVSVNFNCTKSDRVAFSAYFNELIEEVLGHDDVANS